MAVYLLHFDRPFHHARHYMGYARDVERRLAEHRQARWADHHALIVAVTRAGIGWQLARVWPDRTRDDERRMKRMKMAPRLCPICRGTHGPAA